MIDSRQRFLFEQFPIRGELVRLDQSTQKMFDLHQYPDEIKVLLGEFCLAAALMSATIKFKGSLILQFKAPDNPHGCLTSLLAECKNQSDIRAIAQYKTSTTSEVSLHNGQLIITIEPEKGNRYQGIVDLSSGVLATSLEGYFEQSEQLPTRIWLSQYESGFTGMLIQAMPGSSSLQKTHDDWSRVVTLAGTIKPQELTALPFDQVLFRLFHEDIVRTFPKSTMQFQCSCSLERSENAIRMLGESEARTLLAERQGNIEVDCQFCCQKYNFNQYDLNRLFQSFVH